MFDKQIFDGQKVCFMGRFIMNVETSELSYLCYSVIEIKYFYVLVGKMTDVN